MLRGSLNHVPVTVSDLDRAMTFFGPLLERLGYSGASHTGPRGLETARAGLDSFLALDLVGDLTLDGAPGNAATTADPGTGGAGASGGSDGGDGARIEVSTNGQSVTLIEDATGGLLGGGGPSSQLLRDS